MLFLTYSNKCDEWIKDEADFQFTMNNVKYVCENIKQLVIIRFGFFY